MIRGAAIRLAGLAPPESVFKLKHPPVTKAILGENSEITIEYERPWRSKNVHMQLKSTSGIKLNDKSLKQLLDLADKFYIIEKGKTVWEGFSQNLTSQIAQKYLGV